MVNSFKSGHKLRVIWIYISIFSTDLYSYHGELLAHYIIMKLILTFYWDWYEVPSVILALVKLPPWSVWSTSPSDSNGNGIPTT